MTEKSKDQLRDHVERQLADKGSLLTFSPMVKARYEEETGTARCRHLVICGLFALALYNVFLISDWRLIRDISDQALIVRLAVVTPLALLIVAILLRNPSPFVREASQTSISIIVTASMLHLSSTSDSPLAIYHHFGVVLVILFANVVQQLHFPYAVAASIGTVALYVGVVLNLDNFPGEASLTAIMIMIGAAVFTLIANYTLERQLRLAYLLGLRDRLRQEELEALARIDPLTGLGNRRQLDRRLDALWTPTAGASTPVGAILIDVDHFKAYNDNYGHPAGDLCLKRIAALIAGELRGTDDVAFRFGGEEFVVILARTDMMDGVRIAERIRKAIEAAAIPHAYSAVAPYVTVSLGVSVATPESTVTRDEMILSADTALYAAKRNGRNQVWPPRGKAAASVTHIREVRR